MKGLKKGILILVGLVVGLLALIVIIAMVALPTEAIRDEIVKQAETALKREVKIESLGVGFFPKIAVNVEGITISNAEGFSAEPFVDVKAVSLSVDFMSLLAFSPVIDSITITEPKILVEVDPSGKMNLPGGDQPDGSTTANTTTPSTPSTPATASATTPATPNAAAQPLKLPMPLDLKEFRIDNASVVFNDMGKGTKVILGRINQKIAASVNETLTDIHLPGELKVSSISVDDQQSGLKKGDLRISLQHDVRVNLTQGQVDIKTLRLGFQDVEISLQGKVLRFNSTPELNLSLKTNEIQLKSLLAEIPQSIHEQLQYLEAQGSLQLNATVQGSVSPEALPTYQASLNMKGLGMRHTQMDLGLERLDADIQVDNKQLNVKKFNLVAAKQPVSLTLVLRDYMSQPYLEKLNLNAMVNFEEALKLAARFAPLPEGLELRGNLNANLNGSGPIDPNNPTALNIKGEAQLKVDHFMMPDRPHPTSVEANMNIANLRIDQTLKVKTGQSDLNLETVVTNWLGQIKPEWSPGRTKIVAKVRSQHLIYEDLIKPSEEEATEQPQPEAPPEEVNPEDDKFPVLPDIELDFDMNLKSVQWKTLEMSDMMAKVTLLDSVVQGNLSGGLYTGGFQKSFTANLKDPTHGKINGDLQLNRVEANDFISRLNDLFPEDSSLFEHVSDTDDTLYGKLSLISDGVTEGRPSQLLEEAVANLKVTLEDGRIAKSRIMDSFSETVQALDPNYQFKEVHFKQLNAELRYVKGDLIVDDWKMIEPSAGEMRLRGKVSLDGAMNMRVKHHLNKQLSRQLSQKTSQFTNRLSEQLNIPQMKEASILPKDSEGRIVLSFDLVGSLAKPLFKMDSESTGGDVQQRLQNYLKDKQQQLREQLDQERQRVEARLKKEAQQEATRVKQELEKRKAEEEKKLKEQLEKEKKKQEKNLKKEAEKLLKGFKF